MIGKKIETSIASADRRRESLKHLEINIKFIKGVTRVIELLSIRYTIFGKVFLQYIFIPLN